MTGVPLNMSVSPVLMGGTVRTKPPANRSKELKVVMFILSSSLDCSCQKIRESHSSSRRMATYVSRITLGLRTTSGDRERFLNCKRAYCFYDLEFTGNVCRATRKNDANYMILRHILRSALFGLIGRKALCGLRMIKK